jgi:hypothetical protein
VTLNPNRPHSRPPIGVLAFCLLALVANRLDAQSTFASVVGTVRDTSGAVVSGAIVALDNQGTSARRSTITDESGSYTVPNLEPGKYKLSISSPGFQVSNYALELLARQTVRIDGQLAVASQTEQVNVTAEAAPVINSEVSNIAETKTGRELVDLPIAITSRASGSTSPMATLTTQPGVQTDANGNISVVGAKPSQLSISIDGISSMGPRTSAPLAELFPSFHTIAEIRVSEVNNTAEFGGTSDITTISKSGTNNFHGGLFHNHMNTVLNARNPFSSSVPKTIMNNFGAYIGGPLTIPGLYKGRDKTFFFAAFEGLRLPKEAVLVQSVPSVALRRGDLSAISANFRDPLTGQPFPDTQIPLSRISPLSLAALEHLYPLPNSGAANAIANNYVSNFAEPITSNQGDLRIDQNLTSSQNLFGRFTYKKRDVITAPLTGSVLQGPYSQPDTTFGVTVAHNWILTPTLVNEIRAGTTGIDNERTFGVDPADIAAKLGLTNLPPLPPGNAVPNFVIQGFQATGGTASTRQRQRTYQVLDNFTWTKKNHTVKFGGDFRFLEGFSANVYAPLRLGQYSFDNSVTRELIGAPYAAFLLGVPDQTRLNTVVQPDSDGYARTFAFYVQDDWKVTSRLTINYGLRWEYHPMFMDRLGNATNFQLDHSEIVNGQRINGRVVIYDEKAFEILNPNFAAATAPTPIVTSAQAGLPRSLRHSQKTDFGPRVGFAWRPSADGKTVIRGGYGRFIQGPLGALLGAGFAIHSANQAIYNQTITNGVPALNFPYPFPSRLAQPGTQFFQQAADINFRDPTIDQWNLTVERDLGFSTGLRLSYNGSFSNNLNRQGNPDQLAPNTVGFRSGSPLLTYPQFGYIRLQTNGGTAKYHSFTAVVNKRMSNGLQLQGSYAFLRNLTNAQGWNPTAFAAEAGGVVTDLRDKRIDWGNVAFSRRHRFLTTFLYELPFGKLTASRLAKQIIGGWDLAGVALVQSGPFLTITVPGADPSGTGFPQLVGNGRADIVSGVSPVVDNPTPQRWLNPAAYAVPASNIGRYPTSPVGGVQGPGTFAISMSLNKTIQFTEAVRLQIGGQAANLLNHVNYAPPNTTFNTAPFGTINNVQAAEGAGPRQMQLTARLVF